MVRIYEELLKCKLKELNSLDPIYTLSGGIDSSLIFSYLDKPECFCVQVDGNDDYEFAKKLYHDVIKIEFNNVDIEKILTEIQSILTEIQSIFYCNISDMFDYFVYQQFPDRLIIVGEEPRFDNGNEITKDIRKLFFYYRYFKVDSPYMYNKILYKKDIIYELGKRRLPSFITKRKKRNYSGPNPVFIAKHKDQIDYLKNKYKINVDSFGAMWRNLNYAIWRKIHI